MNVEIDSARCTGHGRCYVLAPEVFVDDDAGYGTVRDDIEPGPEHLGHAQRAASACPEQAILVRP